MANIIYILTNPSMPGLIKIGVTSNLEERIRSLSSHSGVAIPFECFFAFEVENAEIIEAKIHKGLEDFRVNAKREFFRIDPIKAQSLIEVADGIDITPIDDIVEDQNDREVLNRERQRMSVFRFSKAEITPGIQLTFSRNPEITATVIDDRQIEFEGQITSLSNAASVILQRDFGANFTQTTGPKYWCVDGETLWERRLRLEFE